MVDSSDSRRTARDTRPPAVSGSAPTNGEARESDRCAYSRSLGTDADAPSRRNWSASMGATGGRHEGDTRSQLNRLRRAALRADAAARRGGFHAQNRLVFPIIALIGHGHAGHVMVMM